MHRRTFLAALAAPAIARAAPVLARDAAASLRRWGARDILGTLLFAATDELAAPDDRTLRWQLKSPFPLLPFALGKMVGAMAVIMPERLAAAGPAQPVTEIIGSGAGRSNTWRAT